MKIQNLFVANFQQPNLSAKRNLRTQLTWMIATSSLVFTALSSGPALAITKKLCDGNAVAYDTNLVEIKCSRMNCIHQAELAGLASARKIAKVLQVECLNVTENRAELVRRLEVIRNEILSKPMIRFGSSGGHTFEGVRASTVLKRDLAWYFDKVFDKGGRSGGHTFGSVHASPVLKIELARYFDKVFDNE